MESKIQVKVDDEMKSKVDELLEKLEKSREHASQGMFRDADEVVRDMRVKYGL